MRLRLPLFACAFAFAASGCGDRTLLETQACPEASPQCVQSRDACEAPVTVAPTCDLKTGAWTCPASARVYARAATSSTTCLPFHEAGGPIGQLGGSLVRVPVDGGRCLWVAETVVTSTGESVRNVGFEQASAPFGSCPTHATFLGGAPVPAVTIEGGDEGSSILAQIDGGYRLGGRTYVLYRLFQVDASAIFGVSELGSGLGSWDEATQQIVVPGPSSLRWAPTLDLGDASLVVGGVPYVFGCHGPAHFLTNDCNLARLGPSGAAELFAGSGDWVASGEVGEAATVFDSGPWISSVVPSVPGGFVHVYAVGFGSTLETHEAPSVTGPWSAGPTLAACDLAPGDSHGFCAGPVVHSELADPTRPGERVVSYGVGSTANQTALAAASPEAYWTRLVWVTSP
jgi:hypothetical protein